MVSVESCLHFLVSRVFKMSGNHVAQRIWGEPSDESKQNDLATVCDTLMSQSVLSGVHKGTKRDSMCATHVYA